MRVGIVGAGFAGLAAAVELSRAGVDVIVLEARDRVGGRVWSQELIVEGRRLGIIERGAEFVLEGYDSLRRLAAETGLHVVDTGMSYYVREVAGIAPSTLREAGRRLIAAADGVAAGRSADDVLRGLGLDADVEDALRARAEMSCAFPADRLDAGNLHHVASFAPTPSHRIAEGNQALADALAARLAAAVRRSCPVRRVVHTSADVELVTDDDVVTVDRAVIAVPLPVVRTLDLDPPLPDWKRTALERLAMGEAAKLHLPLASVPGVSAVMSVPDRFWTWTATGDGGVAPILHAFAGSPGALQRLGLADGPDRWVDRVRELRPDLPFEDHGAVLTTWSDDPWARGAYAAWLPGSPGHGDDALSRPVGAVHFAGEHTAGAWSGLMEGALRSGERAAEEILRAPEPAA